jgi:hypothetical protein
MNFRKTIFILSDQLIEFEDGKDYPNPKNDLYIPGQDATKDRYKREVNSIKDLGP